MKWHKGGEGWNRWAELNWDGVWWLQCGIVVVGCIGGGGDDCVHAWRTVVVSIWTCTEEKIKLIKQWPTININPHWIIKHNLRVLRTQTRIPLNMFIGCRHDTQSTNYLPSTSNREQFGLNRNLMFHSQCSRDLHIYSHSCFLCDTRHTHTRAFGVGVLLVA